MKLRHPEGARSKVAAPLCWNEPDVVVQASYQDGSWVSPLEFLFGQAYTGKIIYLIWPGKTSGSPKQCWKTLLGVIATVLNLNNKKHWVRRSLMCQYVYWLLIRLAIILHLSLQNQPRLGNSIPTHNKSLHKKNAREKHGMQFIRRATKTKQNLYLNETFCNITSFWLLSVFLFVSSCVVIWFDLYCI